MARMLDKKAVRDWLSGQKAAEACIEAERISFLLSLSSDHALQIYLDLSHLSRRESLKTPSPVLLAMRRALARLEETRRK